MCGKKEKSERWATKKVKESNIVLRVIMNPSSHDSVNTTATKHMYDNGRRREKKVFSLRYHKLSELREEQQAIVVVLMLITTWMWTERSIYG